MNLQKKSFRICFLSFMQWIFKHAYGIRLKSPDHLRSLGFRILPAGDVIRFLTGKRKPSFLAEGYLINDRDGMDPVHYLLTFRPSINCLRP